jgi:hypothetical protein
MSNDHSDDHTEEMAGQDTGFKDKQGKPIHYGDILQLGLGISDRVRKRVIRFGKHVQLINADDVGNKYGGYNLSKEHCARAVIIDHQHKPFM